MTPREPADLVTGYGPNGVERREPFGLDRPATPYDAPEGTHDCPICLRPVLPIVTCQGHHDDDESAIQHLRTVLAAAHSVPGNIEVPRQVWASLNAAEDYLNRCHPEEF
jgi:hypothetical protein